MSVNDKPDDPKPSEYMDSLPRVRAGQEKHKESLRKSVRLSSMFCEKAEEE
jgi:hypothetical protein